MVFFFTFMLIALLAIAVGKRGYQRDFLKKQKKKSRWLSWLLPAGLWAFDVLSKKQTQSWKEQREWAEAIYVRENPDTQLRCQGAKQMAVFWICLFCAGIAGLAVSVLPDEKIEKTMLERPEFGETQTYHLVVDGLETEPQNITIEIDGQEPEPDGMKEVFDEAYESLQQEMLGENHSLREIRENLSLPASTIYGIRALWTSLTPEVIDSSGRITAEVIPDEGLEAELQVKLSYSMYEYYYEFSIRILPPEKNAAYYIHILQKKIDDANSSDRQSDVVLLPEQLEGKRLAYQIQSSQPVRMLPAVLILLPVLLSVMTRQKNKEAYDKRNRQLIQDYPAFVFELGIMIQCGMTVRSAWNRLAAEYEERISKCAGSRRFLYEEVLVTRNQIEAGESEAAAYGAFGRRCREHCYVRLGSNLEQNVRQGTSGLEGMLDQEMTQALEQRKNYALQEGERMETKMLFPMFLLLGLVMAVLIIPAFMSL